MTKEMKFALFVILFTIILFGCVSFASASWLSDLWDKITGNAVSDSQENSGEHTIGPSETEQACMKACASIGCNASDRDCMMKNSASCQTKCNAQKPTETNSGTTCMETCVLKGCDQFDFTCQGKNQETCEKECDMLGDKPDESEMSEEQKCITECVGKVDKNIRCQSGEGGEKGNDVCQKCAAECVHLYAGPCLNDEKLKAKQKECETCEHCYGQPVMGDSGEGYECTVDVVCQDASAEFGDDPGTGPGIAKKIGNTISNIAENIGDFFSNLFGNNEENTNQESTQPSQESETSS